MLPGSSRGRTEGGFTLVETLIAMVVLVVGLLALFYVLITTVDTSQTTRAREGAVTLTREITEDARAIPFSQLAPATIVQTLQGMPGLANTGSGSTWQLQRRGFTYTVNATECSIDDPKDGYGQHNSTFCADSTVPNGTTLTDSNPVDLKRVTVTVQWTLRGTTRSLTEVDTITSAGEAVGLNTSNLVVASPSSLAGSTTPTISSTSISGLTFSVTSPSGTSDIIWTVDGTDESCAFNTSSSCWTATQNGTQWTSSTWSLNGLADGTYEIGAAAENTNGVIGPAVTISVTLIRSIPSAPDVTDYGYNTNLHVNGRQSTAAELQWQPNSERNVAGYRIYNPSGTLICSTTNATSYASCGSSAWCTTPSSCIDLNPPSPTAANLTYKVAAVYFDANGVQQEGPSTSVTMQGTPTSTYTFAPSTQNTGSNCSGGTTQDMLRTFSAGTDATQTAGTTTFCSDPFSSGSTVESGGTATAYFANSGTSSCTVKATLSKDGSTGSSTSTQTIPSSSSTKAYTFSFTDNGVQTMDAGDRLNLSFDATASGCSSTVLHYGSSSTLGQFQTPTMQVWAPTAPASVTVTPQSDGTAIITWPQSSGGAPVSFYRIYRDGGDYQDRYSILTTDNCLNGTCTFTDTRRSGSHSYYITAVGSTTPGANMAESPPVGPASG